jgi:hypothetical protein
MKAISLWPPYASFIVCGLKRIETRSWPTKHRGPIAIHQTRTLTLKTMQGLMELNGIVAAMFKCGFGTAEVDPSIPLGRILGTANLVGCHVMTKASIAAVREKRPQEIDLGDFRPGRFMWMLGDVVKFPEPVPAKGKQGIWEWVQP